MNKLRKVILYEWTRHVFSRRFVFGLLSVPLVIVVMAAVVVLLVASESDKRPAGYIDHSGLLASPVAAPPPSPPDQPLEMRPFASEAGAEAALQAGQIQAYFVIPEGYAQSSQAGEPVQAYALKELKSSTSQQFQAFLRANLLAGFPPEVVRRITEGSHLTVRTPDGSRQMSDQNWVSIFVPFFTGFAFMAAMFTASGYLMQAVVEEKENRTMEVLVTSLPPGQLIAGKIIGIIGVGLAQLGVWLALAALVIVGGRSAFPLLQAFSLPLSTLLLLGAIVLPAFVMVASLMAAVGSTVTEAREGQQITGLFTLPVVLPYLFTYQMMSAPNSPLAVGLSFFPLTAPVALTLRMGFTQVPGWQVAAILAILVVAALGSLWLAGRAFRLGMLQYGQRLSLRKLFQR